MLIARSYSSQSNNEWLTMEGKEFYFKPENKNVGLTGPLGELLYFYIEKELEIAKMLFTHRLKNVNAKMLLMDKKTNT